MKSLMVDIDADEIFGPVNLTGTPERNLLMAVLVRAILDYVGNEEKEVETATEWLFDDLESAQPYTPYSFSWICEQLDLDREQVAAKVRAMPKRGSRRVAPWYFSKEEQRLAS